jgi:hypothetical protein
MQFETKYHPYYSLNIDGWNPRSTSDGFMELTPDSATQSIFRANRNEIIGAHLTIYSASQPGPHASAEVMSVNESTIIVRPID